MLDREHSRAELGILRPPARCATYLRLWSAYEHDGLCLTKVFDQLKVLAATLERPQASLAYSVHLFHLRLCNQSLYEAEGRGSCFVWPVS